ncbi:MAG: potassium channel family protein [Acidimicrobiia bacterium]
MIAGCGRVGSDLALSLAEARHDVSVIDQDERAFSALGTTFNGTTHFGKAYDTAVLREASIQLADAFVAATDSDNANLMAVELVKEVFDVPKTIARLHDPARADSYRTLGVEYVAGSKLISKVILEEIVDVEFHYHVTFSGGDVEIIEMTLGPDAEDLTVADFEVKDALRVAAVRRGSHTHVPRDDFTLREGDLVVAASKSGARSKVRRYVAGSK